MPQRFGDWARGLSFLIMMFGDSCNGSPKREKVVVNHMMKAKKHKFSVFERSNVNMQLHRCSFFFSKMKLLSH